MFQQVPYFRHVPDVLHNPVSGLKVTLVGKNVVRILRQVLQTLWPSRDQPSHCRMKSTLDDDNNQHIISRLRTRSRKGNNHKKNWTELLHIPVAARKKRRRALVAVNCQGAPVVTKKKTGIRMLRRPPAQTLYTHAHTDIYTHVDTRNNTHTHTQKKIK